ncbi:uncharacterized protein N7482_002638 [Penicillium canariense]|uniref:TM7S3/TM198-like domain-containing protein n=1 Tax=Penicillium canariense TaxID=189055 RepID=A0A9W9IJC8_9EURO|nr:uncharacterized protein N7482_002638 [Penicillium canariense]KAJ5176761.1 hypothetical protein N7482_002638 [Penicillium canariense]
MQWPLFSTLIFVLLCGVTFAAPAVDLGRQNVEAVATLEKRAEPVVTTTAADNTPSQTSTAATTNTNDAATTATATATTATNTTSTTTSNTSNSSYIATTIPSLDGSTGSTSASENGAKQKYSGGLPIQPQITPALGVGGIILLLSGAAQAIIGIRKQWVHIFLSTAFSAALGVTVLIVYVMNPPVSNAVQGGYLVAVFFTGAVFGGLALVFREITEGLGCLLGGFCMGMWFLTVKPGGLVTDSGAKTGFIIAFTVGFWCLSFSHYTRSYGLVLCTAFSGATALVLGIDCYSRAGLKEFWLYVWGLNDDMFPLNTNTYPVTRNIRVELAVIIIITAFGVIAQMRLWKVIKERRAKEETSRKEAERKNEEAEAEVGRQLEEKNLRERTEWENIYGNGAAGKEPSLTETAVAEDSRRGSEGFESSTNEKGASFEMKDIPAPDQSTGASDSGRNLDAVEEDDTEALEEHQDGQTSQPPDQQTPPEPENERPPTARPVTMWPEPNLREDNDSEHGAVVGSEPGTPRSKRVSGRSLMNRLSWHSGNGPKLNEQSQSQEALVVQDDENSSVAGVVDDISSGCPSIVSDIHSDAGDQAEEEDKEAGTVANGLPTKNVLAEVTEAGLNSQAPRATPIEDETAMITPPSGTGDGENDEPTQRANGFQIHQDDETYSQAAETNNQDVSQPKKAEAFELRVQPKSQEAPSNEDVIEQDMKGENIQQNDLENELPAADNAQGEVEEDSRPPDAEEAEHEYDSASQAKGLGRRESPRLNVSTVKNIPEQTSRVVHSFRTNEWAKHLAYAEMPEIEPIQLDNELPESSAETGESAAPVHVEGLLQTPLNAHPLPVMNSPEQTPACPEQPRRQSDAAPEVPRSKTRNSMHRMSGARSPPPMARNVSSASLLPRQERDEKAGPRRSTSTPFLTVSTPHEEQDTSDSPRWSGPPPLLAVRETMVRNRMSSTSLRYDPYASRSQSRLSLADPTPIASPPIPEERDEAIGAASPEDEDDLPLSKRRALLQRQTMQSPSAASLQSIEPARSPPRNPPDSGRPAAVMAAWRQSVREDLSHRRDPLSQPSSPATPASPDRPRGHWGSVQQMHDTSAAKVENTIAERMQRGSMTDLHRQAMRRMQASANRKL